MPGNPKAPSGDGNGKARFGGLLTQAESQNAIGTFTEPKEKLEETFQASWFDTPERAQAAALLRFKIKRFNLGVEREELIRDTQAAMCSVDGRSFKLSIMGIVGILFPQWLGWKGRDIPKNFLKRHGQKDEKGETE